MNSCGKRASLPSGYVYPLLAKVEHLVVGQDYGSVHYLVDQLLGIVFGGKEVEEVGAEGVGQGFAEHDDVGGAGGLNWRIDVADEDAFSLKKQTEKEAPPFEVGLAHGTAVDGEYFGILYQALTFFVDKVFFELGVDWLYQHGLYGWVATKCGICQLGTVVDSKDQLRAIEVTMDVADGGDEDRRRTRTV